MLLLLVRVRMRELLARRRRQRVVRRHLYIFGRTRKVGTPWSFATSGRASIVGLGRVFATESRQGIASLLASIFQRAGGDSGGQKGGEIDSLSK